MEDALDGMLNVFFLFLFESYKKAFVRYMMQQGGVSKATKTINLSEDIFAGMDFTLRGSAFLGFGLLEVPEEVPKACFGLVFRRFSSFRPGSEVVFDCLRAVWRGRGARSSTASTSTWRKGEIWGLTRCWASSRSRLGDHQASPGTQECIGHI